MELKLFEIILPETTYNIHGGHSGEMVAATDAVQAVEKWESAPVGYKEEFCRPIVKQEAEKKYPNDRSRIVRVVCVGTVIV